MLNGLIVIVAEGFKKLGVGMQKQHGLHRPEFQVRLGIANRDGEIHVPEIRSPKALRVRNASLLGRPFWVSIQPPSLNPVLSTTNVSLSHRPTEYPNHAGSSEVFGKGR